VVTRPVLLTLRASAVRGRPPGVSACSRQWRDTTTDWTESPVAQRTLRTLSLSVVASAESHWEAWIWLLPTNIGGERGIRTRKEALQINKLLKQKRAKAP